LIIFNTLLSSKLKWYNCETPFVPTMLAEEADDSWVSTQPILKNGGGVVTWAMFRREFLNRYFPEDVRGKKEIEFL